MNLTCSSYECPVLNSITGMIHTVGRKNSQSTLLCTVKWNTKLYSLSTVAYYSTTQCVDYSMSTVLPYIVHSHPNPILNWQHCMHFCQSRQEFIQYSTVPTYVHTVRTILTFRTVRTTTGWAQTLLYRSCAAHSTVLRTCERTASYFCWPNRITRNESWES